MQTIIEVGASHGDDTLRLSNGGKNRVFAFEPVPELFPIIHQKMIHHDNFYLSSMAVDIVDGWQWFNVTTTPDRGASSLHQFNEKIAAQWNPTAFVHSQRFMVMTTRLDTFMNTHNIKAVDYLWIDAQGNDFRVLQSLGERIHDVREGKCEASYTDALYTGVTNDFKTIGDWLVARGFEVAIAPIGGECDVHFRRRS